MTEFLHNSKEGEINIEELKKTLKELQNKNLKLSKIEENLVQDNIKILNKKMSLLACIEEMLEDASDNFCVSNKNFKNNNLNQLINEVLKIDKDFNIEEEMTNEDLIMNIKDFKKRLLGIE
ncbi:hypothetical protein QEN19_003482 [Hanseniaspora menglaensis]